MHISEIVFKRKPVFYFILICIIIGGIYSFMKISKLEDPEITVKQAKIITIYPGASAHEVEMQVTDPLENELSSMSGIEHIMSQSNANVSIIDVDLSLEVPEDEIQHKWTLIRRTVNNVTPSLPEGCQAPIIYDDIGDVYGMFYAMTADGFSYAEMSKYAEFIKREFQTVEGVSKVAIYGEQQPCVDIILSNDKMSEMGLFPVQVMSAISSHNNSVYPGHLQTGDQKIRVAVDDKFANVNDIKDLIISSTDGSQFKLSDIAEIVPGYNEPLSRTMFINNEKAYAISISMASGENIIELGKRIEEKLAELEKNLPVGIEFEKVFFQPDKVSDSIKGFMWNLIASVIIVVIVLMITMGLRSGLIIGSGLILTILATFPLLMMAGGTLQRISFGAFIVAMGMLVDNAIVVIDGIIVDMQLDRRRKRTFINTAKRTYLPLLGATIIAVAAFLPVYLSPDTAGTYVNDLFVVLCISLFISWILAITQVPVFSARFLKVKKLGKGKDPYSGVMFRVIKKILTFGMKNKTAIIVAGVFLLIISTLGFKYVKNTFFPDFNYNQVYIEYKLPEGTTPNKVNKDLKNITEHFLTYEKVKMVVISQGATPTRYSLIRPMGQPSDSYGELIVNFEDYETMIEMKPILEEYLHNQYPDALTRIRKYNLSIKSSHTIEAEFSGPDPKILKNLANQAKDIMYDCEYTNKFTISDDWEAMGKTLFAKYDQASARRTGTTRSDVSNAILAATDGLPIAVYNEGETEITINLKTRNTDGSRIENLNDVPVWSMIPNIAGIEQEKIMGLAYGLVTTEELSNDVISPVPLSSVTKNIDLGWEESVVMRKDGSRTIQAQCDPTDGFSPAKLREAILNDIEAIELPEGYSMKWVGEHDLQSKGTKNIYSMLPISVMIIIIVLILLFNGYKKPAIVILCIPLAIIGIVPGHIISGAPFSFVSIIGAFGLMGMLVKNSIVLIDEIGKQIKEGEARYHAVINSTISRVRPVIMASFTTILGMIPLFWDPMYSSMAVTIISGLLIGTLITLLFVPVLFSVFFGVKNTETKKRTMI